MKKVRITVKKIAHYDDLMEQYENPIEHACTMRLGQTFIANGWERPARQNFKNMVKMPMGADNGGKR